MSREGKPPGYYQHWKIQRRCRVARKLLANGRLLKEIAFAIGWKSHTSAVHHTNGQCACDRKVA